MRRAVIIILVAVAIWLQVGMLPAVRPLGVVPNIMLVLVVLLGLRSTVSQALVLALSGGVAMDMSSGSDFGLHTGLLVLAALSTGLVRRSGFTLTALFVPMALVAAGTLAGDLLSLANILGNVGPRAVATASLILAGELVVNLLVTLGMRPLIERLVPDEAALPQVG